MRSRAERRPEGFATVLVSVAGLATSWAGYQAALWNGDQVEEANASIAARALSTSHATKAGQLVAIDVGMFSSWLIEQARGDPKLARFFQERFRDEFKVPFNQWMASNPFESATAAPSPFALPSYHLRSVDSANHFETAADSLALASSTANRVGDTYVLTAVVLATVMFFVGTARQTVRLGLRWALLGLAAAVCMGAVIRLLTLPRG